MKHIKLTLLLLLIVAPAAALAIYKPARVLLPEVFGVSCDQGICVDDSGKQEIAVALFNTAKETLETRHGLIIGKPKMIFCSTDQCLNAFGLGKKAGFTLGAFGVAIAPRGWKDYYVAHELVHYWQAETFGSLFLLNGEPWLVEGMAYALSNDPREALSEPFETYRRKFTEWHRSNEGRSLEESVGEAI